jgi:MoxR-like ATPase
MEFRNIGDLVNQINAALGEFCNEFGRKRKELAGLGKVPKRGILFTYDTAKENNWAINEGGGTELQYHIVFDTDDLVIKYGLGFNTQYVPFANQMSTVDYMQPFMYGYLKHEKQIKQLLPDYDFVFGNIEQLKKPKDNEYTLLGKKVSAEAREDKYFIEDSVFNLIVEDLKKQFEPYQIIFKEKNNFKKSTMNIQSTLDVLAYKKQIILQGPPGTGKTREAKIIAKHLIADNLKDISGLSKEDILNVLHINTEIKSVAGSVSYKIVAVDSEKVTLSRESETTGDTKLTKIIEFYNSKKWNDSFADNDSRRAAALANYIYEALSSKHLEGNETQYLKLIQFHPAYSYEDFVRGIVAESKGEAIEYKTKNKLLADFAKKASTNYNNSKKAPTVYSKEKWIENQFSLFVEDLEEKLESEDKIELTKKVFIFDTDEDAFRYKGQEGWVKNGNRMLFSDIKKAYFDGNEKRQDIKKNISLSGLAHHHASYYIRVLDLFKAFLKEKKLVYSETQSQNEDLKSFVLIIDEINRANLPAVLGELIYALEYRGEKVDSMYATDEDGNTIIIPPNLYIIGTMNTSDRSVGHIDYAIRRRFAFIDILPKVLEGDTFELELFKQVSALFIQNFDEYVQDNTVELKLSEHLSEEFRPEDVWLGHSYFIKGEGDFSLRKKYEIVPILKEYVKDGILKQSAEPIINELSK